MIRITTDAKELADRLEFAAQQTERALSNAVARAARTARREAISTLARDANVSPARAKQGQPTVRAGSLVATWTPNAKRPATLASTGGVAWTRAGGLTASTFTETGGRSTNLNLPHAFILKAKNGGRVALNRTIFGPGTHRRVGLTRVHAENANVGMAQDDAAPRRTWDRVASDQAQAEIERGMQAVLDGYAAPSDSGGD